MNAVTLDSQSLEWTDLDQKTLTSYPDLCKKVGTVVQDWLLLVNIQTQTLHALSKGDLITSYRVSTAERGTGQKSGSFQTPLGLHEISEKFGDGADPYEIFESRESIKEKAIANDKEAKIIGRILWLNGLEAGFNQGKNSEEVTVDSKERYIYIHGTNVISQIGRAVSAGCVRMRPEEVIQLFDQVPVGAHVYIYSE